MLYIIHKILNSQIISNDSDLVQIYLKLSGLVKKQDTLLIYSNKIYQLVFTKKWLDDTLLGIDRPYSKDLNRWLELDKDSSALLRGEVLKQAIEWANVRDDLTNEENLFLRESIHQESLKYELKLNLSQQSIDERLKQLTSQLEEDKNYEYFTIPLSICEKIEVSETLLKKYNFTDKDIIEENSAIVQIVLNLKKEFVYQEKISWLHSLAMMSLEQKQKFFNIIQNKALINIMDVANDFIIKKEYTKAISFYLEYIKIDSTNYDIYNNLGIAYYEGQEYIKAIEAYKKAIKTNPKNNKAYENIAMVYIKQKNYDASIKAYNKSIEINPKNDKAYNGLGDIYYIKEEYDKAIEVYTKAIKINPKSDKAYNNLGDIYSIKEEYEKALETYNKAININPNNNQESRKNIIEFIEKKIKTNPNNYIAYNNMGNTYSSKKEYNIAIWCYQKAIEINPQFYQAYYNLGNAYQNKEEREYHKAIGCYHKAIEINPNDDKAYTNMFELQLTEEKFFNKTLEKKYIVLFKDKKNSFIIYEMLKIFSQINQNQAININEWLEKYQYQTLDEWNFDKLEEWIETKEGETKEKLLDNLTIFKYK